MQTIQQQRAAYALERIKQLTGSLDKEGKKSLKAYASGLPAMIHMNGLGQALAFTRAKGADSNASASAHEALYSLVSDWLCREGQPYAGQQDVMEGITRCDQATYIQAQAETQALMNWVKKFAKAYLADVDAVANEGA